MPLGYFSKEWTVGIAEVSNSADRPGVVWPASYYKKACWLSTNCTSYTNSANH